MRSAKTRPLGAMGKFGGFGRFGGVLAAALVAVPLLAHAQVCEPIETDKLLAYDGAEGDGFGISIAIGDGIIAVGADHDDDNGSQSGSAYLFDPQYFCLADLTRDGFVDAGDLGAFITHYLDGC